jgi:hypothetical protein
MNAYFNFLKAFSAFDWNLKGFSFLLFLFLLRSDNGAVIFK